MPQTTQEMWDKLQRDAAKQPCKSKLNGMDKAAIAGFRSIASMSEFSSNLGYQNREFGGSIYQRSDGSYYSTRANIGKGGTVNTNVAGDGRYVGYYHTHNLNFSSGFSWWGDATGLSGQTGGNPGRAAYMMVGPELYSGQNRVLKMINTGSDYFKWQFEVLCF